MLPTGEQGLGCCHRHQQQATRQRRAYGPRIPSTKTPQERWQSTRNSDTRLRTPSQTPRKVAGLWGDPAGGWVSRCEMGVSACVPAHARRGQREGAEDALSQTHLGMLRYLSKTGS